MKKDEYDVIIIGAGIGGLTAGNILAKNGMKVLILEKNPVPGGAVTTFYRDGFPIDISHATCGFKRDAFMRKLYEYLDIYNDLDLIELNKSFIFYSLNKSKIFFCYNDKNQYAKELYKNFPTEKENINRVLSSVEYIWNKEIAESYYNPSYFRLMLYPFMFPHLTRLKNASFDNFLNRFTKNENLKDALSYAWPYLGLTRNKVSALYLISVMSAYSNNKTYFVRGGFGVLSNRLALNFKKFGGQINTNVAVEKVTREDSKSFKVKDKKNNFYLSNKLVCNCDVKKVVNGILDPQLLSHKLKNYCKFDMSCSLLQIHLVVRGVIDNSFIDCGSIVLPTDLDLESGINTMLGLRQNPNHKVFLISIKKLSQFNLRDQNNLNVINIGWIPAQHDSWFKFINKFGLNGYEEHKNSLLAKVVSELKKFFNINEVIFSNVLTPISFEKWLDATEGAMYGFSTTPKQILLSRMKNITAIPNLYFVGSNSFPGPGIAGVSISATACCDVILDKKLTRGKFILN